MMDNCKLGAGKSKGRSKIMFGRHFHGFERHTRLFEKGDLKYVILDLLKDKPSHGYEIIRALESSFHGFYSPSAGSVYPTLQLLEDMGYVKSSEQDGKKVFTITEDGRKVLHEREETIDKIKDHMRDWWGFEGREEFHETFNNFRNFGREIGREANRLGPEKMAKIKMVMDKAFKDIEAIVKE
jgi:DNA-binding PadR family transcriptional regulator